SKVWLVACGTAYYAGAVGRTLIERLAQIPAEPDIGSEFRYRSPLVGAGTPAVAISQSGETADTLGAAREARGRGARLLAVANVVGSTLAREADDVLYTRAGPEIAVCSTKAFVTQLAALTMLATHLGQARGTLEARRVAELIRGLRGLPARPQAAEVVGIATEDTAKTLSPHVDRLLTVPAVDPLLAPAVAVIPLQLLAYHVARLRGHDVDQPRNLAKSVTVE